MTTYRKPFAYVNKYTGKMFYLNEQPDAATDTDVYFPLWLHPQPFRENKESSTETIRKSEDSTTNANHTLDAGKMIIPEGVRLVPFKLLQSLRDAALFEKADYENSFSGRLETGQWKNEYAELTATYDAVNSLLATSPPQQWIKCSERLPEDDGFVLVTNGKHVGVGAYLRDEHLEDGERWQDEHFEFIDLQSKYPVTHWMPLPEVPIG